MHKLFPINVLGVVLAAVWAGYVSPAGHLPILGIAAAVLFLVSMVLPFWHQHRALDDSFGALEADMLDGRRPRSPGEVEIFTDTQPSPVFRRAKRRRGLVLALTVLAALLLIGDVAYYFIDRPPPPPDRGVISNF